jgi:lysophospholipase L1-like esterase
MRPAAVLILIFSCCFVALGPAPSYAESAGATAETRPATVPTESLIGRASWAERHQCRPNSPEPQDRRIVFIGDSITLGWFYHGKEVWLREFGALAPLNLGYAKDDTENVLWRINNGDVDHLDACELIVLLIGTNNTILRHHRPEDTAAGIEVVVERLRHKVPHAKILLLAILPHGQESDQSSRADNKRVNEIIADLGNKRQVYFLNTSHEFLMPEGALRTDLMPDRLHPNEEGYGILAQRLRPVIRRLMARR